MVFCGIDQGFDGAMAFIDNDGNLLKLKDMPVIHVIRGGKNKRALDIFFIYGMFEAFKGYKDKLYVGIEKTNPVLGKFSNASANWNLGFSEGMFMTIFMLLNLKYEFVSPQTWQAYYSIQKVRKRKKATTKDMSYAIASRMVSPKLLRTERGRILDGRCDAILIANYIRSKYTGGVK